MSDWEDLYKIAFDTIKELSPDVKREEWVRTMVDTYIDLIYKLYGSYPLGPISAMEDLWNNKSYKEPVSGICMKYSEWAEHFSAKKL